MELEDWIGEARKGSHIAWRHLVRRYAGMAHMTACSKLGDPFLAEDAVQEAFAEAFVNLEKLAAAESFPGWLKIVVTRQCYRILRRKRHKTVPIEETIPQRQDPFDVGDLLVKKELQETIHRMVDGLPLTVREPVQLFYFQGYSIREIASYLGVSQQVVKKRLFDARRKLRSALVVTDFVAMFKDLYEGGPSVLHIVNGDHVGEKLKQGNIQGEVLVWREIYTVGPVYRDMKGKQERQERAGYLERALGISAADYIRSCETQEQAIGQLGAYDEVVLWFEHDLFDQTILWYLLHEFAKQPSRQPVLNLLSIGEYPGIEPFRGLGQLSAGQLGAMSGTWSRIGREELELGSALWEAYVSSEVEEHGKVLQRDTSALPFARGAWETHLARLPSVHNGLGIIEQAVLELAGKGMVRPSDLFREIGGRYNGLGMGDLEFAHYLNRLLALPLPLIEATESGAEETGPGPLARWRSIAVTEEGKAVASGQRDGLAGRQPEIWVGGLRIQEDLVWRWDPTRKEAAAMARSSHPRPITVVSYNPDWVQQFEQEKTRLLEAMDGHIVTIEHAGSTSIPDMDAKPIIDMFAAVPQLREPSAYEEGLSKLGYAYVPTDMSGRHLFARESGGIRTHHLHLLPLEGFCERNELLLRDYLRAHPELVREYGDLKRRLAEVHHSMEEYTRAKTAFIQKVIDRARSEKGLPLQKVWEE